MTWVDPETVTSLIEAHGRDGRRGHPARRAGEAGLAGARARRAHRQAGARRRPAASAGTAARGSALGTAATAVELGDPGTVLGSEVRPRRPARPTRDRPSRSADRHPSGGLRRRDGRPGGPRAGRSVGAAGPWLGPVRAALRRGVPVRSEAQLLELPGLDRRGRVEHEVRARRGLGEGHDLADVRLVGEQGDPAVDAEGDAAVRRRAVLEGLEDAAELGLLGLARSGPCSENERESISRVWKRTEPPPSSQPLRAMSYWSARARPAGSSGLARERVAGGRHEERLVLGMHAAEGVVRGVPARVLGVPLVHREVVDPDVREHASGRRRRGGRRARRAACPSASWAWMSASATMSTRSPGPPPGRGREPARHLLAHDLDDGARGCAPWPSRASQTRPWAPARRASSVSSSSCARLMSPWPGHRDADDAPALGQDGLEDAGSRRPPRARRGRGAPCRSARRACPSRSGRWPRGR